MNLGWFILQHIKGSQVRISKLRYIQSMRIVHILANSAEPDEMLCYAAFHLGLHCLPAYLFRHFQCTQGLATWPVLRNTHAFIILTPVMFYNPNFLSHAITGYKYLN